jgi:hypothetical protein
MKKTSTKFNYRNWKVLLIILFPIQWLFFSIISSHHHFIETYYSNGLYKVLSFILRIIIGWIPFSLGEIIIYSLFLYLIAFLIWSIYRVVKKKIKLKSFLIKLLVNLVAWASLVYFLFMILWGLNYHREPLITVTETNFTTEELRGLCELLITETNNSREKAIEKMHVLNMDKKEIIAEAYEGYKGLTIGNKKLDYKLPSVKRILFTDMFSYLGVTGIYNPFTGEANVNMDPPDFLMPATVCHEMAHEAGIAPEDEANYVAYIVCKRHRNPFFQYSGYLMAMRYAMNALKKNDRKSFDQLWKKISDGVKSDLDENRLYWLGFKNPLEKYSDKVYDSYLKANNQKAGIRSYGLMVRLLLNDYTSRDL